MATPVPESGSALASTYGTHCLRCGWLTDGDVVDDDVDEDVWFFVYDLFINANFLVSCDILRPMIYFYSFSFGLNLRLTFIV